MYDIYGDWNLVIAAYNCGPGTINKAIRRAGGETDYWKIYNLLPKETRGYVPAFIAANYVMTYYCDHNICPMETNIPASTDTVQVTKNLHFEQIAELCKCSAGGSEKPESPIQETSDSRHDQTLYITFTTKCHQYVY